MSIQLVKLLGPIGMRPNEGFSPKAPTKQAGMRTDPAPSEAVPIAVMPEAIAADAPPLEPPEVRSRFHGLRVAGKSSLKLKPV